MRRIGKEQTHLRPGGSPRVGAEGEDRVSVHDVDRVGEANRRGIEVRHHERDMRVVEGVAVHHDLDALVREDCATLHLDRTHGLVVDASNNAVDASVVEREEDVGDPLGVADHGSPDEPLHDLTDGAIGRDQEVVGEHAFRL